MLLGYWLANQEDVCRRKMTLINGLKGKELLMNFVPNNVVSVCSLQAQLLRSAGWEVGRVVCPSRVSAACKVTLLCHASLWSKLCDYLYSRPGSLICVAKPLSISSWVTPACFQTINDSRAVLDLEERMPSVGGTGTKSTSRRGVITARSR